VVRTGVAREDRGVRAVFEVGGDAVAAGGGAVEDIVVEKRGGVNQFGRYGA
jgi:hypothetical protein